MLGIVQEREEVVVEDEGRLLWHQLLPTVDYKVLYFMLVDLVECCLIRVHRTLLYRVAIA